MRLPLAALAVLASAPAAAQDSSADLAQKLSNPVASLIQVPVQNNSDWGWGLDGKGFRYTANIQPVIPISVNDEWNMISRTIVPVIAQNDVTGPGTSQFGLGDVVQSIFFSPKAPTSGGIIWGAGPVLLVPTATDSALGGGKLGTGATIVVLKQAGQSTFGFLGNHIWSIAGKSDRGSVSASFLQPFYSYTTKGATTYALNTETTYDWLGDNWLVPINVSISQLVVVGKQPISVGGGVRYWVASPTGGPDWGLRFNIALLFPK
jgi:hypothetical protein